MKIKCIAPYWGFTVGKVYEFNGTSFIDDEGDYRIGFIADNKSAFEKVEEPNTKFAVGDKWKTRSGNTVTITKIDGTFNAWHDPKYPQPIEGKLDFGGGDIHDEHTWSADGTFWPTDKGDHKNDLVEKVSVPADGPETWKKGDVIRCIRGNSGGSPTATGKEYIVESVCGDTVHYKNKNSHGVEFDDGFYTDRFVLVRRAEQAKPLDLSTAKVGDTVKLNNGELRKVVNVGRVWTSSKDNVHTIEVDGDGRTRYLMNDGKGDHASNHAVELIPAAEPVKKPGILAGAKVGDRFKTAGGDILTVEVVGDDKEWCPGVPREYIGFTGPKKWRERNHWYYEDGCSNVEREGDGTRVIEKIEVPAPTFLPIGSYIKFVRNSRSGRYKKGQVGRIADHGPKSMVVHVHSFGKGFDSDTPVFLPPERPDIYEAVEPVPLSSCKWMDLVIPLEKWTPSFRWYAVYDLGGELDMLTRGHPQDDRNAGHTTKYTGKVIVLGHMKTVPFAG